MKMGKDCVVWYNGDLLDNMDIGMFCLLWFFWLIDSMKERKKSRDIESGGYNWKGFGSGVMDVFIDVVDIGMYGGDYVGKIGCFGEVGNDFLIFDLSVVIFIDKKRFYDDKDFVDIWMNKIIKFVENMVDDFDK